MTIDIAQRHSNASAFKLIVPESKGTAEEDDARSLTPTEKTPKKESIKESIDSVKKDEKEREKSSGVSKDAPKIQHKRAASINVPEEAKSSSNKSIPQVHHRRTTSDPGFAAKKKTPQKREKLEDLLGTLADQCETLGEAHPKTASTYNELGTYHFRHGDYDAAESSYAEALKCYQMAYKVGKHKNKEYCQTTGAHQVSVLLNNIATVKWRQGNLSEATSYIEQSLDIQEGLLARKSDTLLIDPVEVGGTYYNLGIVHSLQGNYKQSLNAFKDACDKYQEGEHLYGPMPLEKARFVDAIGKTYMLAGNPSKAIKYIKDAIGMKREVLDKYHPSVLRSLSSLADVFKMEGDVERATRILRKVLRAQEKSLHQCTIQDDWDIIAQDIMETKKALIELRAIESQY